MAKVCYFTGRKTVSGNNRSHAMNKTKRAVKPNLQKVTILVNGKPSKLIFFNCFNLSLTVLKEVLGSGNRRFSLTGQGLSPVDEWVIDGIRWVKDGSRWVMDGTGWVIDGPSTDLSTFRVLPPSITHHGL